MAVIVRGWRVAATIVGLVVAGAAAAAAREPLAPGSTYVALGSSFAAGPGVTERAEGSPVQCNQSRDNYARQVARARRLTLVDRSCGGATTVDVLRGGQFGLPAQLDGVTADARLVTVTIGGNDVRYMADLGAAVCRRRPELLPEAQRARACAAPADFSLEQAFAQTAANLRQIAAEVRRRAPKARLVFVDYVTVLPAGAPCAALSLSAADADELRARAERLARLTEAAARETGGELIKASELTRGHDACAAEPWVNAVAPPRAGSDWGPVSFHPREPAMTAVAHALEQRLRD